MSGSQWSTWTTEQDAILRREWPNPKSTYASIAELVDHHADTVKYRALYNLKLGHKSKKPSPWTPEVDAELTRLWQTTPLSAKAIGAQLGGLSKNAVLSKAKVLGLPARNIAPGPKAGEKIIREPKPRPIKYDWSGDRVDLLCAYWTEGRNPAEIATLLKITRSAVLSKAGRLGLVVRTPAPSEPRRLSGFASSMGKPRRIIAGNGVVLDKPDGQASPLPPVRAEAWEPLPGSTPVKLVDREAFQCRWPVTLIDETDYHMCGLHAASGRYCVEHTRRSAPKSAAPPEPIEVPFEARRRAA